MGLYCIFVFFKSMCACKCVGRMCLCMGGGSKKGMSFPLLSDAVRTKVMFGEQEIFPSLHTYNLPPI